MISGADLKRKEENNHSRPMFHETPLSRFLIDSSHSNDVPPSKSRMQVDQTPYIAKNSSRALKGSQSMTKPLDFKVG